MEIWKDVPEYEGRYQISNMGRIKSLDRYARVGGGSVRFVQGGIIKPIRCKNGYLEAPFSKNGIREVFLLHRLVAQLFIPNPNGLPQINHKDENLSNNSYENLEWCTAKYNANYGTRNRRYAEKVMKPVNQYDLKGKFIKKWIGAIVAELELGIHGESIARCCMGKQRAAKGYTWKYVEEE